MGAVFSLILDMEKIRGILGWVGQDQGTFQNNFTLIALFAFKWAEYPKSVNIHKLTSPSCFDSVHWLNSTTFCKLSCLNANSAY